MSFKKVEGKRRNTMKTQIRLLTDEELKEAYVSTERGQRKPACFFEKKGFSIHESRILMTLNID
jgi:hypothetical protein